jgi:hypothetical protein
MYVVFRVGKQRPARHLAIECYQHEVGEVRNLRRWGRHNLTGGRAVYELPENVNLEALIKK